MSEKSLENVKAVLFDLDETLIDAQKGLKAAYEAVGEKIFEFLAVPEDKTLEEVAEMVSDLNDRMNRKRNYNRDEWWPKFVEETGFEGELTKEQIEELTETYWSVYEKEADPYPQAKPILEYLSEKGYLIGLLTDTDDTDRSKKERIYPLSFSGLLGTIVAAGKDTENTKPDPEPYRLAASNLGVRMNECAMVGDKPFTDIKGAKSVGMITNLKRRRNWDSDVEADFTINSLQELQEI